jgi:hypothetical protein
LVVQAEPTFKCSFRKSENGPARPSAGPHSTARSFRVGASHGRRGAQGQYWDEAPRPWTDTRIRQPMRCQQGKHSRLWLPSEDSADTARLRRNVELLPSGVRGNQEQRRASGASRAGSPRSRRARRLTCKPPEMAPPPARPARTGAGGGRAGAQSRECTGDALAAAGGVVPATRCRRRKRRRRRLRQDGRGTS